MAYFPLKIDGWISCLHLKDVESDSVLEINGVKICDLSIGDNTINFTEIMHNIHRKEWYRYNLSDDARERLSDDQRLEPFELFLCVLNDCSTSVDDDMPSDPSVIGYSAINAGDDRCTISIKRNVPHPSFTIDAWNRKK